MFACTHKLLTNRDGQPGKWCAFCPDVKVLEQETRPCGRCDNFSRGQCLKRRTAVTRDNRVHYPVGWLTCFD